MASDGRRFVETSVEVYEYARSLVAENKRLRERQKWIDEVARPDHPDDERPWAAAYLDARQRIEGLTKERDRLREHAERLAVALDPFTDMVCTCNVSYRDRGLTDPTCERCRWENDVIDAMSALAAYRRDYPEEDA